MKVMEGRDGKERGEKEKDRKGREWIRGKGREKEEGAPCSHYHSRVSLQIYNSVKCVFVLTKSLSTPHPLIL